MSISPVSPTAVQESADATQRVLTAYGTEERLDRILEAVSLNRAQESAEATQRALEVPVTPEKLARTLEATGIPRSLETFVTVERMGRTPEAVSLNEVKDSAKATQRALEASVTPEKLDRTLEAASLSRMQDSAEATQRAIEAAGLYKAAGPESSDSGVYKPIAIVLPGDYNPIRCDHPEVVKPAPAVIVGPVAPSPDSIMLSGPGGVLANDVDADGDVLSISDIRTGDASKGSVTVGQDGSVWYTPKEGAKGEDKLSYTVSDGKGGTDTATITIKLGEGNRAPDAKDDKLVAGGNQAPVAKDDVKGKPDVVAPKPVAPAPAPAAKPVVEPQVLPPVTSDNAKEIAKAIADLVADVAAAKSDGTVSEAESADLTQKADKILAMGGAVGAVGAKGSSVHDAQQVLAERASKAMADGNFTGSEIKEAMGDVASLKNSLAGVSADEAFFKRLSDILAKFVTPPSAKPHDEPSTGISQPGSIIGGLLPGGNYAYNIGKLVDGFLASTVIDRSKFAEPAKDPAAKQTAAKETAK